MSTVLKAEEILLRPWGLDLDLVQKALAQLQSRHLDFGDIFFEKVVQESFGLEEGLIKSGSFDIAQGVGIRAVLGEKTGFAYSEIMDEASLMEACRAARSITSGASCKGVHLLNELKVKPLYEAGDPIASLSRADKAHLLESLDQAARACDPRVCQVMAGLSAAHRVVLIANTDGTLAADIKPTVSLQVSVVMEQHGRREQGFASTGGAFMLSRLNQPDLAQQLAHEAVRIAAVNLEAVEAPAGTMPVVTGAGWPGVLIHEAVGHGLEGDFNRRGTSVFSGKLGSKVASSACTIIDDGTMPNRRGSLSVDDEGIQTQRNVLIENGVLKGYMQDRQNALLMGMKCTGNGRREGYDVLPMPRMTNTYMLPGPYSKEEIIASVDKGIYAVNFNGGQVDITSGKFVFSASEAYKIEHGRITVPIKGATLIGSGIEAMQQVSMVGNDLDFDQGIGVCGKNGQSVPVGIGQPTVKLDALTVGGTAS